jgi:hypothetical protein
LIYQLYLFQIRTAKPHRILAGATPARRSFCAGLVCGCFLFSVSLKWCLENGAPQMRFHWLERGPNSAKKEEISGRHQYLFGVVVGRTNVRQNNVAQAVILRECLIFLQIIFFTSYLTL